jgi:hypothetical protein
MTGMFAALVAAASMWFFVDRVLVPYQIGDAATHDRPRGNLSDLYPRWLGARELLLHGRNPYSPEITREIQVGYYGRVLDPSRPDDPLDQQGFAYPVYVVFVLAPTIRLPFPVVQKCFALLLWVVTAVSVPLWLRALAWRPHWMIKVIFIFLALGSIAAVPGIKLQQLSLLVAGLLAGSFALVAGGQLFIAGILLGLASIKPQLVWLPALLLVAWSVRDWRRRQSLFWGLALTAAILFVGAELVLPGWVMWFRAAVENYHQYTHNLSVLGWISTPLVGNILAAVIVLFVAILCWPLLKADEDSAEFAACIALALSLAVLVVPMFAPYNQVLLFPAILLGIRYAAEFRRGRLAARLVYGVGAILVVWPWIAALGLMFASLLLAPRVVQSGWKLPFVTTLAIPMLVFGVAALHAVTTRRAMLK